MSGSLRKGVGAAAARLVISVIALSLAGCGDEDTVAVGGTSNPPPASVIQSSVALAGAEAPPNPETGATTAPELNLAYAQVYQLSGVADTAVQKVLVLVPGFLAGANTFDYLARRIVERTGGTTAVWAVDRRSNALEDQTGFDAAEAAGDPDIAKDYYFHGKEVNGRTFAGFLDGKTVASFESEWGMSVHVQDVHAIVAETLRRYPHASIFLGGHSLGGAIVPIYAAWDFNGEAGFERLSGLLLLEGAPSPSTDVPSQQSYETSGISGGGGRVSLRSLRTGDPISSLKPFVGTDLFVATEIIAMRTSTAFGDPQGLSPDGDLVKAFVALLFGLTDPPMATNRATLGFGFDNDFEPLSFARVSIGTALGPIGPNPSADFLAMLLGVHDPLLAPIDPTATYDWIPRDQMPDPEPTDIETFARILFAGPSNFIEWYFPARLLLDVAVTGQLDVQRTGDWRKDVYGLDATENARVDVPVFAIGGSKGLLSDLSRLGPYHDSIASTLRNGSVRDSTPDGFRTMLMDRYVHIDVLTADDSGPGNGEFAAIVDWMDKATKLAPRPR